MHNFKDSLKKSEQSEKFLDDWLVSLGYEVQPVSLELQKQGADRIAIKDNFRTLVEYKTDYHYQRTGNIYIETIGHKTDLNINNIDQYQKQIVKAGWIYHSIATMLVYHLSGTGKVLVGQLKDVRDWYKKNASVYDVITIKNEGFEGSGRLIPLENISQVFKIVKIIE